MSTVDLVWYFAYGSNMSADRFRCYLAGGRPAGASRTYAGARDPSPPRAARPVERSGALCFALRSSVWGGGIAFLDPRGDRTVAGRAWLITRAQFEDVFAQETRHSDSVCLGESDGLPLLSFTGLETVADSSRRRAPSSAYLQALRTGLAETFGWDQHGTSAYLRQWLDDPQKNVSTCA